MNKIIKRSNSWLDDQPLGITTPVKKAGKLVCRFLKSEWNGYGGNAGGVGLSDTTGYDAYGIESGSLTNGIGIGPISITGQPNLLKQVPQDNSNEGIGTPVTFANTIKNTSINGKIGLWVYLEGTSGPSISMNLSTESSATNGISINWTSAVFKQGWNFLVAVLRNSDAYIPGNSAYEIHPDGVIITTLGTGAGANIIDNPISYIRIYSGTADTAKPIYFDSLWTDFETTPQYTIGVDASTDPAYALIPLTRHRGYAAVVYYYISDAGKRIVTDYNTANFDRFYEAGWEVVNHSATHIPGTLGSPSMGTLTDAAQIAYEVRAMRAGLIARGYTRGMHFYVSPNSSTSYLAERVIGDIGYPLQRHGIGNAFVQITPYGIPNPRACGGCAIGNSTTTYRKTTGGSSSQVNGLHLIANAREHIDTVISYGATIQLFTHGVETDGDDGSGNQVPINSNFAKYSHYVKLMEYLNAKEDAGLIRGLDGSDHLWYGD